MTTDHLEQPLLPPAAGQKKPLRVVFRIGHAALLLSALVWIAAFGAYGPFGLIGLASFALAWVLGYSFRQCGAVLYWAGVIVYAVACALFAYYEADTLKRDAFGGLVMIILSFYQLAAIIAWFGVGLVGKMVVQWKRDYSKADTPPLS